MPVKEDTVMEVRPKKPDSLREKIYFRSIRFGTDVLALALSSSPRFRAWEVNADADFGPFYLVGDYGRWGKDETMVNGGDYHNEGTYWRAGVDVSILKKDPDRNMLFFGLRYARSSFSERLNLTVEDPYFGTQQYALSNPNASAAWGEIVAGLRVKVWKEFWMGFTSRLKLGLSVRGNGELSTYDVPGYGVIGGGSTWGFNYQVFWRIPFERKKKPAVTLPVP
ncbi:MAG: hypothetical protein JNN04_12550 [Cyclobacteriaceae bacterium]|nr:hypothetical protein [Cyclobacteriaceae bacterium]